MTVMWLTMDYTNLQLGVYHIYLLEQDHMLLKMYVRPRSLVQHAAKQVTLDSCVYKE